MIYTLFYWYNGHFDIMLFDLPAEMEPMLLHFQMLS